MSVALVLAGGGARGAYEFGALSVLLPRLAEDDRPDVIVGTSVGALNAAYLAARAHDPLETALAEGCDFWREVSYRDVLSPLVSTEELPRLLGSFADLTGLPRARMWSLLNPEPLLETLRGIVSLRQIRRNVQSRAIRVASVVASSASSGRSVVFHDGGRKPKADRRRGLDYVPTALDENHVRASAAIPGFFPAVRVTRPPQARGWYFDGGTRLNTPIKPALRLGADRVIIVALNSLAPGPRAIASATRADAFDGAGQLLQAVLVDPLVHDVQTLATVNQAVGDRPGDTYKPVPYILIAPRTRDAIGECAAEVYRKLYSGLRGARRSPELAALGHILDAGLNPVRGELFSYLFFAPEFAERLIELGRQDARRWLAGRHDIGPWRLRAPP
jgi:NTE family protein